MRSSPELLPLVDAGQAVTSEPTMSLRQEPPSSQCGAVAGEDLGKERSAEYRLTPRPKAWRLGCLVSRFALPPLEEFCRSLPELRTQAMRSDFGFHGSEFDEHLHNKLECLRGSRLAARARVDRRGTSRTGFTHEFVSLLRLPPSMERHTLGEFTTEPWFGGNH